MIDKSDVASLQIMLEDDFLPQLKKCTKGLNYDRCGIILNDVFQNFVKHNCNDYNDTNLPHLTL